MYTFFKSEFKTYLITVFVYKPLRRRLTFCQFQSTPPAMQVSKSPNFRFINSNYVNPNSILRNSNYFKFKNLGYSTFFPGIKLRVPNSNCYGSSRRRRFASFIAAAAKSASSSDYYSVLNVSRNATLQEIKAAYRSLARKVYMHLI